MLISTYNLASQSEVFDAVCQGILDLPFPIGWELIYEHGGGSFDFTTSAGLENTTNAFKVMRAKLLHNSGGSADAEFTNVIVENDVSNNRLLIRLCASCSAGGVTSDVTPLASAQTVGALTNVGSGAAHVNGTLSNLSISTQDAGGFEHVWINSYSSVIASPDTTSNQFVVYGKSGVLDMWTLGTTYNPSFQGVVKPLSEETGVLGGEPVLSTVSAGDSTRYLGKVNGLLHTSVTSAFDFDRMADNALATDIYFYLKHSTGAVCVLS